MNESMKGIKNIKFNAWEGIVTENSNKFREEESSLVRKYFLIRLFFDGIANSTSVFLILSMVLLRIWIYGDLSLGATLALIAYGN